MNKMNIIEWCGKKNDLIDEFFEAVGSQNVIGVLPVKEHADAEMILSDRAASGRPSEAVLTIEAFQEAGGTRIKARRYKGRGVHGEWLPTGTPAGPTARGSFGTFDTFSRGVRGPRGLA